MTLLAHSFFSLQCFGVWQPIDWTPGWKPRLYFLYTIFIVYLVYSFTIFEFIDLFLATDSVQDFTNNLFMLLSFVSLCGKILIVFMKRSEIIEVVRALESDPHKARTPEEQAIQDKFDRIIRFFTLFYAAITEVTVTYMTIAGAMQFSKSNGTLPYKAWIPYDYSTPNRHLITYGQQLISVWVTANIDIGFDTIIPGFIMQMCIQFNIMKHRFHKTIAELEKHRLENIGRIDDRNFERIDEKLLAECIRYHLAIFDMAEKVNSIFTSVIFLQYSASSIIICASIYIVSQMPLFTAEFAAITMYLVCMLIQIFLLCITGNEATLECTNLATEIYNTNWLTLSNRSRKYLILMMLRTRRPIVFTSGHIISLSLDSFKSLLKMSYSAYNLLQHSAN